MTDKSKFKHPWRMVAASASSIRAMAQCVAIASIASCNEHAANSPGASPARASQTQTLVANAARPEASLGGEHLLRAPRLESRILDSDAGVAATQPSLLREQRQVKIDGILENWSIVWRSVPQLVCLRWDCTCSDFLNYQRGQADLVRVREGQSIDTFALATIYSGGLDTPEREKNEALLPGWPNRKNDEAMADDAKLSELVKSRSQVPIIDLHDFDHDGRATEFVLPVGGAGCAMHASIAVGITKQNPRLHAFGTVLHPDEPLMLSIRAWELLRRQARATVVDLECGFRGADTQVELELRADSAGIHVTESEYSCPRQAGHRRSRVER